MEGKKHKAKKLDWNSAQVVWISGRKFIRARYVDNGLRCTSWFRVGAATVRMNTEKKKGNP